MPGGSGALYPRRFAFGTDLLSRLLSNSSLIQLFPYLSSCGAGFISGAPHILVPVSTLAGTNIVTFKTTGMYPTLVPKTTSGVPNPPASPSPTVVAPQGPSTTISDPSLPATIISTQNGNGGIVLPQASVQASSIKRPPLSSIQQAAQLSAPEVINPAFPVSKTPSHDSSTAVSPATPSAVESPASGSVHDSGITAQDTASNGEVIPLQISFSAISSSGSAINPSGNQVGGLAKSAGSPQQGFAQGNTAGPAPASSTAIATIFGQTAAINPSGVSIAGTLLSAGGPGIKLSGTPVSIGSAGIVLAGSATIPIPFALSRSNAPQILSLNGQTYAPDSASRYTIGSQTLVPGGSPITVGGIPISLAPSVTALIVGSRTSILKSTPTPQGIVVVGSSSYVQNSDGGYAIAGQTLRPGSAITVSGTPVSLGAQATNVVVGSSSGPVLFPTENPGKAGIIVLGSSSYTQNSQGAYNIAGQTLKPGSAITVSGTPIFLAAQGTSLVIGSSTAAVLFPSQVPAVITFGASAYTANAGGAFIMASQTLFPGSAITVSGTPISLAPSATQVVIGSITQSIVPYIPGTIIIASSTYTANSAGAFVINHQTLFPGSAITVSGTPISLGPQATDVTLGSSTEAVGLGGAIASAFGGSGTADGLGFTGGAKGRASLFQGAALLVWGTVVWLVV